MIRSALPAGFVIASLLACAGCQRRPNEGTSIDMTVTDRNGAAALEFGKWVLVFEGIPAARVPVGTTGYIYYPLPGVVSFSGGSRLGDLLVNQNIDSTKNAVTINDCAFTIVEQGSKLVFPDETYLSKEPARVIVISKEGKTRDAEAQ